MKKIIILHVAFMAIFYSASSQSVTNSAFYAQNNIDSKMPDTDIPQKMNIIFDSKGGEVGMVLIYEKGEKKVFMSFILYNGLVKAGSKSQDTMEELLVKTYVDRMNPKKAKIRKRIYAREEETGEKFFVGLMFRR